MKCNGQYKILSAVFAIATILLCFCKSKHKEGKLFSDFDSIFPVKGISMTKNTVTSSGNSSFRIYLYYWDNYLAVDPDIKNKMYLNGSLVIEDDMAYYIDSASQTKSLLFSFTKDFFSSKIYHTKEYIYDSGSKFIFDTTIVSLKQTFWSRMYNDVIYVFRLENTGFYETNDSITLFVSNKSGILGVYSSVVSSGNTGPSETIFSYSGDIFPYIYDFSKVVFLNKLHDN
ncbi:MAG: hypothetical protein R2791_07625 [Saprospiraceae bacterium]